MNAVFIGGCERSGTTLLASMLGGAAGAVVTPESQFKYDFLENFSRVKYSDSLWRLKMWGISSLALADYARQADDGKHLMKKLVHAYAESGGGVHEPSLWIDHTPSNLRNVMTLSKYFEDAKFVHIVRDGRAVAASVMQLEWGPGNILDAADWWLRKLSFAFAAEVFLPERVTRVKYEDLLENPERELRKLCKFLDIDYNHQMLTGQGFRIPGYTQKQHMLVGCAPDNTRLYGWRAKLTDREVEMFEFETKGILQLLGYEIFHQSLRRPSRVERVMLWLKYGHMNVMLRKLRRKARILLARVGG